MDTHGVTRATNKGAEEQGKQEASTETMGMGKHFNLKVLCHKTGKRPKERFLDVPKMFRREVEWKWTVGESRTGDEGRAGAHQGGANGAEDQQSGAEDR